MMPVSNIYVAGIANKNATLATYKYGKVRDLGCVDTGGHLYKISRLLGGQK